MATRRSTGCLGLSLSLLLSASLLVDGVGVDLKIACAGTPYPEYCTATLSAIPESAKAADAHGLVEVAAGAAAKMAAAAATLARAVQSSIKDGRWWCFDSCAADMEDAASRLGRGKLVAFFKRTEKDSVVWNCDDCRDESSKKADLISKDSDFEKMMAVVTALVKHAGRARDASPAPVLTRAPAPSL